MSTSRDEDRLTNEVAEWSTAALRDGALCSPSRARYSLLLLLAGTVLIFFAAVGLLLVHPPAGCLLLVLGLRLWSRYQRLSKSPVYDVLTTDTRRPVVYLRAFGGDHKGREVGGIWLFARFVVDMGIFTLARQLIGQTEEEMLIKRVAHLGPPVAIGLPGELTPPAGAQRLYVGDGDWKAIVTMLMERSQLIIFRVGTSPGAIWEFEQIAEKVAPERIIIDCGPNCVFPFILWERLPVPVEYERPEERFISFDCDWRPQSSNWFVSILRRKRILRILPSDVAIAAIVALVIVATYLNAVTKLPP